MGFEITLGMNTLGSVYPLIIPAGLLLYSTTFSNHDGVLFCTLVSTIMLHVTRCCVVVTSYFTLSPEFPESCNLIICIFLNVCSFRDIHHFMVI